MKIRAERIELFTTMCRRASMVPPATLSQLLECLLGFDLYRRDLIGTEIRLSPRLWRNPLDVLPFTAEEAVEEAGHQQRERAMLAGAALRRLADTEVPHATDTGTVVTASLRAIADPGWLTAGQVRPALALLSGEQMLDLGGVDLGRVDLDTPIELLLPWHFAHAFNFEELPPPEHFP